MLYTYTTYNFRIVMVIILDIFNKQNQETTTIFSCTCCLCVAYYTIYSNFMHYDVDIDNAISTRR